VHEGDAGHGQRFERGVGGERLHATRADPCFVLSLALKEIGAAAEREAPAADEDDAYILSFKDFSCDIR
jgi:hypothetical protein